MWIKHKFHVYTENLISGLEKYALKNDLKNDTAVAPRFNKDKYNRIKTIAVVIDKITGKVLVDTHSNGLNYNLPIAKIDKQFDLESLWEPCLDNLNKKHGIIAQIGNGLGTIYPLKRSINFKKGLPIKEKEIEMNEYHVFEMKDYQENLSTSARWESFETVFKDLLRWRKFEQVEALLRTQYVAKTDYLKETLASINYHHLTRYSGDANNYLYSSMQKYSTNVFVSGIIKQKVDNESFILLASRTPQNISKEPAIWNFPQFPVLLSSYPNMQDTLQFYLGGMLLFKNSMLFMKALFSANIKDEKDFYKNKLVASHSKKFHGSLLNWDFNNLIKYLHYDYRYLRYKLLRVCFDRDNSTNNKKNITSEFVTNGMLPVSCKESVFVEDYYFDSMVICRDKMVHPLTPFSRNGIDYKWVTIDGAFKHFRDTKNELELILLTNYTSKAYIKEKLGKLFSRQDAKKIVLSSLSKTQKLKK
ncbi:hypothetical protein QEN19_000304 [Hanseniaspora menglaensis]